MKFEALLEERVSKKTGNKYKCLVIKITDRYEKVIFLSPEDIEILTLKYGSNK